MISLGVKMTDTYESLHKRFLALRDKTGANKISSYSMTIYYSPEEDISIELGGYDICDWNRHENIGNFKTEEQALQALKNKIIEAEKIIEEGNYDE
jgi:hypothetical protein